MSDIRAVGYALKDADDDAAYQMLVTDVQRLKQELRKGSDSGAGGVAVAGPLPTGVDAAFLQGVPISAVSPSNGQDLQYNSGTGLWTPTTPASSSTSVILRLGGDGVAGLANAYTQVGFTSGVVGNIDTASGMNFTTDTYTFVTAGYYFVTASAQFLCATNSGTLCALSIDHNGSTAYHEAAEPLCIMNTGYSANPTASGIISASIGDTLKLYTEMFTAGHSALALSTIYLQMAKV